MLSVFTAEIDPQNWLHKNGVAWLPLITVGGVRCWDYAISGQLKPTAVLQQLPAVVARLCELGVPLGRCWIVVGDVGDVTEENYHWYRYRPNIISLTPSDTLIVETHASRDAISVRNGISACIEPYQFEVLSPEEFEELSAELLANLKTTTIPQKLYRQIETAITNLQTRWQATFDRYGHSRNGELAYQDLIIDFKKQIAKPTQKYPIDQHALNVITTMLQPAPPKRRKVDWKLLKSQRRKAKLLKRGGGRPTFDRPIFIVSTPRAGSTLLFETLSQFPDLWTIGIESHETIEGIPQLHPAAHDWESNRLTEKDATPEIVETLKERFAWQLENRTGAIWLEQSNPPQTVRFLEKTPKNALRIPFLKTVFPDAKFIYLYREPHANISSMLEGWRTLRFIAYPQVKGWPYKVWNFLLTPGWRALKDKSLVEIVANQWKTTQQVVAKDLATVPNHDWIYVDYADLIAEPAVEIGRIADFADLTWDAQITQRVADKLPVSRMVLSPPDPQKWRKNAAELEMVTGQLFAVNAEQTSASFTVHHATCS